MLEFSSSDSRKICTLCVKNGIGYDEHDVRAVMKKDDEAVQHFSRLFD